MGSTLKAELSNWIVFIGLRWEDVMATIVMGSHHQTLVLECLFTETWRLCSYDAILPEV